VCDRLNQRVKWAREKESIDGKAATEIGFKQQIVGEVESGLLTVSAAARKYQISGSVE
jgi:hypothetical protein